MILSSITPKCGAMRGGERITIRGQNFVNDNVVVLFTSIDKSIKLEGIAASYTNPKVIEVTAPNCSSLNSKQGLKNWAYVTVSCGGNKCKNRRKYTYLQKCQIVRKCLKIDGHNGRCCRDEPPPLYGQMDAPEISGGRIGTALLGYRLKDKHKPNSMPGPRPPPERKAIPGGVMNMAGMQKSPKEGKLSPRKCATGPIGGLDDARLRMAKESTQTIVLLPGFGHDLPGGKIGTALLGYRLKDKHKPNSMPGPMPPPERPEVPGGVIARGFMQNDKATHGGDSPRKCCVSIIGGLDEARLRMAKESTQTIVLLPGFGHDLPGGRFNLADTRNMKDGKETTGGFVDFQGCGETIQPGGRFNLSGSRKRMFRTTYLDEV